MFFSPVIAYPNSVANKFYKIFVSTSGQSWECEQSQMEKWMKVLACTCLPMIRPPVFGWEEVPEVETSGCTLGFLLCLHQGLRWWHPTVDIWNTDISGAFIARRNMLQRQPNINSTRVDYRTLFADKLKCLWNCKQCIITFSKQFTSYSVLTSSWISLWNMECTPMIKGVGELSTSSRRDGRMGM